MHFWGKRLHIKTIQEHAILWLSALTCTQMPRSEKLLLLRVRAELLTLSLVIKADRTLFAPVIYCVTL